MNTFLVGLFGGTIATLLARGLAEKLKVLIPALRDSADQKIPRIIDSIEEKTGADVPDWFEKDFNEALHNIILRSAAFAEGYIYSPTFWNKVFRALLSSNTSNAKALLEEFVAWFKTVDWQGAVLDSMPEGLRPVVNAIKEGEAVKAATGGVGLYVSSSKAANIIPVQASVALSAEEVRPMVKEAVAAMKLQPPLMDAFKVTGMTKKLAEEITKRHEERMAEYLKKEE